MGQNLDLALSKEELRDLSFGLLREWWLAATQAIVDEAGSEIALKYLKPYFINSGVAGACNIQKILGVDADELLSLTTPIYFYQLAIGFRKQRIFRADDGSSIWEMMDCATGGISKEACLCLCEITPDAYHNELRQGSEAKLEKSLSFGDPSCHMLITAHNKEHKVSTELKFELKGVRIPPPPNDDVNEYLGLSIIGESWSNATRGFIDFASSERALERLRFHMRHSGLSFGMRMSEHLGARERGLHSILEMIELVQLLHQRKSILEIKEEGAGCRVNDCPFSSSAPEICGQYEAFFNGICEAIDPNYYFKYDRMMTKGDTSCHWLIRKKEPLDLRASKEEKGSEDLAKNLALRLSKGEITLEEFEKNIALLRKHSLIK